MKDLPPFPFDAPDEERFIDAVIREKVRLGSADEDAELVRSILTETVQKPKSLPASASAKQDRKLWMIGVASAAAILAVLATLLAVLPFRADSRTTEEVRFIVRYSPSLISEDTPEVRPVPERREPLPFHGRIEINVPVAAFEPARPEIDASDSPGMQFAPSFAEVPLPRIEEDRLQILAEHSEMKNGRRIYTGDVEIRHKDFSLFSDRVELSRDSSGETAEPLFLTAWNVVLEQSSLQRKVLAAQLDYEPATRLFTLSGVESFESPEGHLSSFHPDDRIVLSPTSFSIQNSQPVIKYANPAPLERNRE